MEVVEAVAAAQLRPLAAGVAAVAPLPQQGDNAVPRRQQQLQRRQLQFLPRQRLRLQRHRMRTPQLTPGQLPEVVAAHAAAVVALLQPQAAQPPHRAGAALQHRLLVRP